MIEVHLIGYTADLEHLVLDLDGGADGRYRLVVDPDLFATLDQLRDERRGAGLPVGDPSEYLSADELAALESPDEAADAAVNEPTGGPSLELEATAAPPVATFEPDADESPFASSTSGVRLVAPPDPAPAAATGPGREPEPVAAEAERVDPEPDPVSHVEAEAEPEPEPEPEPTPAPPVEPQLTPAQIQALLRSGRSPRAVAREAGTDVAWIERWLPPIVAERTRVLDRAQAKRLERPRLGRSRDPLGQAVERNLRAKGVRADQLTWDVARRKDGRWKVSVRFSQRDRPRTATWVYDATDDDLRPASDLAHELGFSRPNSTAARKKAAQRTTTGTGGKKPATGKATSRTGPRRRPSSR